MIGGVRWDPSETIAAIASAPGGSLRGVVRVSGPDCLECVRALFRTTRAESVDATSPSASFATLKLDSATTRETLRSDDEPSAAGPARVISGLVALPVPWGELPVELYWWPGARSYTRQPTAEFHTLGSPPLVGALLAAACRSGARLAEPGEFTLRAFLAGRLDLTQAEAVLGVIDARGRTELDVALRQLAGGLAQPLQRARSELLDLLARLEAGLDFVEEDIEFVTAAELDEACGAIERLLSDVAARMRTRETAGGELRVALRGWPNVGKSSLLNALAGRTAALVSGLPGTTRDYVAQRIDLDGLQVLLIDTAGIEPDVERVVAPPAPPRDFPLSDAQPLAAGAESIAGAAQRLAATQHGDAHVVLLCLDGSRPLNEWERSELECETSTPRMIVLTKSDRPRVVESHAKLTDATAVSSRDGAGLELLRRTIRARLAEAVATDGMVVAGTARRCADSVGAAIESLGRARALIAARGGDELLAVEIRAALDQLGQVVGAVYTDDLLDRIFSRFCIGK